MVCSPMLCSVLGAATLKGFAQSATTYEKGVSVTLTEDECTVSASHNLNRGQMLAVIGMCSSALESV